MPYFDASHLAGVLLLIVTMGWGAMEFAHASNTRDDATRAGGGGRRFTIVPVVIVASVMLYLAPHIVPAAAIRPGAAAFAAGLVVLLGGLVLRGWSIKTLGEYFTGRVMVSSGQPVITAGPYRLLRHPSYTSTNAQAVGMTLPAGVPREQLAGAPAKMMAPSRAAQVILDGVTCNKALIVFPASMR